MKQKVIIELTTDEIIEKIDTEKDNLQKLKMVHAVSPLENPMQIRHARKTIARLKTELNKRMQNENKG